MKVIFIQTIVNYEEFSLLFTKAISVVMKAVLSRFIVTFPLRLLEWLVDFWTLASLF